MSVMWNESCGLVARVCCINGDESSGYIVLLLFYLRLESFDKFRWYQSFVRMLHSHHVELLGYHRTYIITLCSGKYPVYFTSRSCRSYTAISFVIMLSERWFWGRGVAGGLKLQLHSRNILHNWTVPLCRPSPSFPDLINKPTQKMRCREGKLLIKSHLRNVVTQCPFRPATMTPR